MRAATLKRAHQQSIDDNPMEILIHRSERVRAGGAFDDVDSYVGLVRGRLYQESTGRGGRSALEVTTPGIQQRNERWGLICPLRMRRVDPDSGELISPEEYVDLDLRDGPHVKDTFDTERGHFEITKVWPNVDEGETWGYRCELEEIE